MMDIRPLADRVLVRPLDSEERTAGGIVVPDRARERPLQGRVVAHGPGRVTDRGVLVPLGVAVGDVVIFGRHRGERVVVDEVEHMMLRESDCSAVVRGP